MENKKETESELNMLPDLFTQYMDGNPTDEVKEAKEYIDDIISELRDISLAGNISDEQICAVWDEYLERVSGSQPLGGITDVMKQSEAILPIFLIGYAIHAGIQELGPIILFGEVCLAHHLLNRGADKNVPK